MFALRSSLQADDKISFGSIFLALSGEQTPMGDRELDLCGLWKIISQRLSSRFPLPF